jgi:YqxM protein
MIKIRYPRLAKFRKKNQKLKVTTQIVAIWYIAFFSIGYLTSNTAAYFTANDKEFIEIQAGYWDESKLDFIKKGNDNLNEFICPTDEFEISTVIKNIGETDMFRDGKYEVYYVETGEPRVNGSKVAEGIIPKLLKGQDTILTQKVTKEGFYMFKTFEDSGQNSEIVIWSEKIKVKCQTSNAPDKGKNVKDETDITEKEAVESTNPSENSKDESKTEPEAETKNSDPNSSDENNTESENNNATEEEQSDDESQDN